MPGPALPFGITPAEFDRLQIKLYPDGKNPRFALNQDPKKGPALPIPSWDQIIRLNPGLPDPKGYLTFVGVDLGLIDLKNLDDETQKAVARRLMVAEKVRSENIPEWRQKMITLMTALDNAEDIISTAAWLLGPYLEKTGRPGKVLVASAKGTSSGINFINKFLRGPELSRKAKHRYMDERKMNARDRVMRSQPKSKAGKWLSKNLGNLIQAAQASESITGVGLQIGTIYGTLENALWDDATTLKTVGELFADRALRDVGFFRPGAQAIVAKRIEDNEKLLAKQPEPWIKQMANWINANSTNNVYSYGLNKKIQDLAKVIADNPFYELETHAQAITGLNLALVMTADPLRGHFETMDTDRFNEVYTEPPRAWNYITQAILKSYGIALNANGEGLLKARHKPIPILDQAKIDAANFLKNNKAWLPKTTDTDTEAFLHAMVISTASISGGILSTTGDPLTVAKTKEEDLVFYALDQAAVPPLGTSETDVAAWAAYMMQKAGPDLTNWRRGGFYALNMAYWRQRGKVPALFNN